MTEVEFLSPADVPADEPSADPERPRWRRLVQPVVLAVVAAGAGTLVVVGAGGSSAPHPAPQRTSSPSLPPIAPVHIRRYLPWHERAVVGGGGAYIF